MSPLFLFTILIPEIIVHDVSFVFNCARMHMRAIYFKDGLGLKPSHISSFLPL